MSIKEIENELRPVECAGTKSLHRHWFLYLIEGIALVVLGALALAIPPLTMVALSIFLGWALLVSGVMSLITAFWMRDAPGFWWSLLSAMLGIGVGVILLAKPVEGGFSLTLLLIAFFIVEGAASIMCSFEHKRKLSGKWEWMLVRGMFGVVVGALIFIYLPSDAAWTIAGLFIGINMVFRGAALTAMALHARNAVT